MKSLLACLWICLGAAPTAAAAAFQSDFAQTPDRVWIGPAYWANPMEDWRIDQGRLECTSNAGNRNVHLLTHQLADEPGGFEMTVRLGLVEDRPDGSAGFRVGIHDELNDYRGNCFFGHGIDAVVQTNGVLALAGQTGKLDRPTDYKELSLRLAAVPLGDRHRLTLTLRDAGRDGEEAVLGQLSAEVDSERLRGNLALVNNHRPRPDGARFWFQDWTVRGEKIREKKDQAFGPILWGMHTLSNCRGDDGYVMKMTAQMPPLGRADSQTVALEVLRDETWQEVGRETIDPDARTATFRVARWPADRDVPYRLVYETRSSDGRALRHEYAGAVRREPADRPLRFAGLTCQYHYGFPYAPLARNLAALDPDVLYFSGDQIYEGNGGYGIIRQPADRATLNYLRKWYMFGWAFGEVMRDRPTLCMPDDHDVFHGNLWGEGGLPLEGGDTSSSGGYVQPLEMVNAVYRTHTAHHPDLFDPTPTEHGMRVMYGDMVYGRVSFAIVSDRQFKSGPRHVNTGGGRADHLRDPKIDVATLDKPGLTMLGRRQKEFLKHWAADWRGADMKVLLSQTTLAGAATHHGGYDGYLIADLDSGGWPQSARNRVLRIARSARAFHVSGDQHLATLIHHGIEQQRDAIWGFCTPAIAVGYQRWWRPDEMGMPHRNRPEHNIPHTGEYLDGLGNRIFVHAVANPPGRNDPNRYVQAQVKASGFGLCVFDTQRRTIDVHCYKFLTDVTDPQGDHEYPGWPVTLHQHDNDPRKPIAHLPEMRFDGIANAVLKLHDQATGELVYAERLQGNAVRPWVYAKGVYTARLGDPDADRWTVLADQEVPY